MTSRHSSFRGRRGVELVDITIYIHGWNAHRMSWRLWQVIEACLLLDSTGIQWSTFAVRWHHQHFGTDDDVIITWRHHRQFSGWLQFHTHVYWLYFGWWMSSNGNSVFLMLYRFRWTVTTWRFEICSNKVFEYGKMHVLCGAVCNNGNPMSTGLANLNTETRTLPSSPQLNATSTWEKFPIIRHRWLAGGVPELMHSENPLFLLETSLLYGQEQRETETPTIYCRPSCKAALPVVCPCQNDNTHRWQRWRIVDRILSLGHIELLFLRVVHACSKDALVSLMKSTPTQNSLLN